MKTRIHVNRGRLGSFRKRQTSGPVITVKNYKENRYGTRADILNPQGRVIASVVQQGYSVYVEAYDDVYSDTERVTAPARIQIDATRVRKNIHESEETRVPVFFLTSATRELHSSQVLTTGEWEIKYSPDKPLGCGARVWVETELDVRVRA